MKQMLEQGTGAFLCAVLPAAGAILRFVLFAFYTHLEKACQRMKDTENKTIHRLRTELRRRKKNGTGEKTIDSYTGFYLGSCRLFGIPLQTLERVSNRVPVMSLLVSGILACSCIFFQLDPGRVLGMLFFGVLYATGLMLIDMFFGIEEKKNRICFCFCDFARVLFAAEEAPEQSPMEQVLAFPLVTERLSKTTETEEREPQKEGKKAASPAKKEEAGKRPEAGKGKKEGRAQEEKRRLTEELLKERRQLNARQYKESKTEGEEEQGIAPKGVQEEFAAAENDTDKYEKILRSVLAEFLS